MLVGRLLEVRANAGYRSASDVDAIFDEIERQVAKLRPDVRHVTVVDWRRCPLMSPAAAKRFSERILATNASTERSAALVDPKAPVAVLQFVTSHADEAHGIRVALVLEVAGKPRQSVTFWELSSQTSGQLGRALTSSFLRRSVCS